MGVLAGKVCVITGAASGLGRAAAVLFASEGARVVIADQNEPAAKAVADTIGEAGGSALAHAVDVTDAGSVERMTAAVVEAWTRIDCLLHCAGIARGSHQWGPAGWLPMEELREEDWDLIVAVDLKGTFLVNQRIGRQMIRQKAGVIVNVASLSGVVANKGLLGHGAYCASKAGVIALTKVLATEWARHNIRVNAISPAYMNTGMLERTKTIPGLYQTQLDMTPMGRYGEPVEFARAALFLASDDSAYVTGHNLLMDGGYTAW